MLPYRRKALSQNFLRSRKLVSKLIRRSVLGKNDVILEIGPGKGIITQELLHTCHSVIAVELDLELCKYLNDTFNHDLDRLTIIHRDFLKYTLPKKPFNVFANIPFSIEGKIVRKLLNYWNAPQESYLVMRLDLAKRICGIPKDSQMSILYKPWFSFQITHKFRKTDYEPCATMETGLLHCSRLTTPLLSHHERESFQRFVRCGFGGENRLQRNLAPFFSKENFNNLAQKLKFHHRANPSDLTIEQWIKLFKLQEGQ